MFRTTFKGYLQTQPPLFDSFFLLPYLIGLQMGACLRIPNLEAGYQLATKEQKKKTRFFHLGLFYLVQQLYQKSHGLEGDQREHYIICKDKYKFKRRGLILPVENKGRNCPSLLFP